MVARQGLAFHQGGWIGTLAVVSLAAVGDEGEGREGLGLDEEAVAELIVDRSQRVVGVDSQGVWPEGAWEGVVDRPLAIIFSDEVHEPIDRGFSVESRDAILGGVILAVVVERRQIGEYSIIRLTPRPLDADEISSERMAEHRLEEIGVLVSGIAHDFNNVLSAILGNAELLAEELVELGGDQDLHDAAADIRTAAERSRELIAQMLGYGTKAPRGGRQAVDLGVLTREMARLLRVSTPQSISFNESIDSVPAVEGDPSQLRQVIMNLIVNAADAIGEDVGMVTIRTGTTYVDRELLDSGFTGSAAGEGDYAFVEVEDSGCGMDDTILAKIFDPFFTTKSSGRGLGLAGVRAIVADHGGVLLVRSTPGIGTTFCVMFPVSGATVTAESDALYDGEVNLSGRRILIVDDEPMIRRLAARLLTGRGAEVIAASDGHQALEFLGTDSERYDCAVVNVSMPFISGIDVAAELGMTHPGLPVLLVSGYRASEIARRAAGLGVAGILQKPFSGARLVAAVAAAIAGAKRAPPS